MTNESVPRNQSTTTTSIGTTRAQRRGSRTTNACEACKKRKTKCSGPGTGPCQACEKVDTFCHFNVRLDTRRKLAYKPSAVRQRQSFILEGILQILKHNDGSDVQHLLSLIRSDSRPQDIASCLKRNLQTLQANGRIPDLAVDETDLVSLGLQGLFSHRAGRNGTKATNETSLHQHAHVDQYSQFPTWNVLQSNDHDPMFVDDTATLGSSSSSEGMPVSFDTSAIGSESSSPCGIVNAFDDCSFADKSISKHEAYVTAPFSSKIISPTSVDGDPFRGSERGGWPGAAADPLLSMPLFYDNSMCIDSIINLPIEQPKTPLDILTLQFRDDCKRMLAAGIPYEQLTANGKVDCELLFRDREVHDMWTIPNWSCELIRLLPPMLPETRLAAALCVARFMAFLVHPCQKTLSELPAVLRPTESQTRIAHDVSINFIPTPMLRNCLLQKSADCLNVLGSCGYRVDWKGDWGYVGGATLARAGRWQYEQGRFAVEQTKWSQGMVDGEKVKAIVIDPESGSRRISAAFEKCCWHADNWSVKRDVLKIWPDLAGHIRLV